MAPHLGQGANLAIEDAAALCNILRVHVLHDITPLGPKPKEALERRLAEFTDTRLCRVQKIQRFSRLTTRLQASEGVFCTLFARYVMSRLGQIPTWLMVKMINDAPVLDFLPVRSAEKELTEEHLEGRDAYSFRWLVLCTLLCILPVGLLFVPRGF